MQDGEQNAPPAALAAQASPPAPAACAASDEGDQDDVEVILIDLRDRAPRGRVWLRTTSPSEQTQEWMAQRHGASWPCGIWTDFSVETSDLTPPPGFRRTSTEPIEAVMQRASDVYGQVITHPDSGVDLGWLMVMDDDQVLLVVNGPADQMPEMADRLGIQLPWDPEPIWHVRLRPDPPQVTHQAPAIQGGDGEMSAFEWIAAEQQDGVMQPAQAPHDPEQQVPEFGEVEYDDYW